MGTTRRAPGPRGRGAPRRFDTRPGAGRPRSSGPTQRGPLWARLSPTGPFTRRSTRRLAVLSAVFVLLAIMLVPTLRTYLVQQQQYRDLQAKVAQQEKTVADLAHRTRQWQDPAFVEAQARARLKYVRPGETSYVVVGAESLRAQEQHGRALVINPAHGEASRAWYSRVWESATLADRLDERRSGAPVTTVDDATTPRP